MKNRSLILLNLKHFALAQYDSNLNDSMSYRLSDNLNFFSTGTSVFETLSDIMVQTKLMFMSSFYPTSKKFSAEKSTRSTAEENGRYYLTPSV